ncbi:ABC transporter substrate-binding protein [Streptomyces sp. SID3343]|uniref:ABC transporter substrate-binding protein n=1 Tax=Streptomyces sp. SID3343 TaxID=2690260 RepID=UPI00136F1558|nr:ABC transporter substrate-binding protein [Streptomyces sp. SID3343]MYV99840.1 substrate-binding domain-containing protein [Streptomyces sp. SID3343]
MKRTAYIAAITVLTAAGALSGCSDDSSGGGKDRKITFIQGVKGDEFYISMACGAQDKAKELGVKLDVTGADKWDASQQTPVVNAVAAKNPAAVLIAPTDTQALRQPEQQLKSRGAKIIEVDTKLDDDSIRETAISSDNEKGGELAAQTLARLVQEKGKVVAISVKPGVSTTDMRLKGFETEIKKHPGITYLGVQYNDDDPAKAASIVTSTLASNRDLAGVFAANVFSGEGAATGIEQAGKSGALKLIAFDATPKQVESLRKGSIQGLIAQKPYDIGAQGVQHAVDVLDKKKIPKSISTDLVAVTKDNVDQPDVAKYLYRGAC